jgi:hypothetical protein
VGERLCFDLAILSCQIAVSRTTALKVTIILRMMATFATAPPRAETHGHNGLPAMPGDRGQ